MPNVLVKTLFQKCNWIKAQKTEIYWLFIKSIFVFLFIICWTNRYDGECDLALHQSMLYCAATVSCYSEKGLNNEFSYHGEINLPLYFTNAVMQKITISGWLILWLAVNACNIYIYNAYVSYIGNIKVTLIVVILSML